ncbi:MAG: hypothetical protein JNM68_05265 [Dinghuibacter sp.]|nr:hypothetical protein [Dinghuibacter sp.]
MKKTVKKLNLKKATVSMLNITGKKQAQGGTWLSFWGTCQEISCYYACITVQEFSCDARC